MVIPGDDKPDTAYTGEHRYNPPPDYSQFTHPSVPPTSSGTSGPESPPTSGPPPSAQASDPSFAPLTPPMNYLAIERLNSSIRGTYSINPSLPPLPGAVLSRDMDGNYLNLRMSTVNGSISAVVDLIRGTTARGPARLEAHTQNGYAHVTIHDRQQNRFRLRVTTQNGAATIRIPSTFIGGVYASIQNGRLIFHPEVQRRVTVISESQWEHKNRYFIGDLAAHRYQNDATWSMDHLHIECQNGDAAISFDNVEEPTWGFNEGPNLFNGMQGLFSGIFPRPFFQM